MLVYRATFPEGAEEAPTGDRQAIHSLEIIPLLDMEMSFTREFGSDALEEQHSEADITELLNQFPDRRRMTHYHFTPPLSVTAPLAVNY
jgi:hypothetical protein